MISVHKAQTQLSNHLERSLRQETTLQESLGYILADDIQSPIDVPSFDNSSKDGYALNLADDTHAYELTKTVQAGDAANSPIPQDKAARIFTGAPLPNGTDTVVMQEMVTVNDSNNTITFDKNRLKSGHNVRNQGSQCKQGNTIADAGTKITPGAIGLLASVGITHVQTYAPPKTGFIVTGNELRKIGSTLKPGEIYDCNGPMLRGLLKTAGITNVTAFQATDDKAELQQTINDALKQTDMLILSGGISVGDYDFVEECLKAAGVNEIFYKVKQKPGKPFWAGKKGTKWVFALPGNPGSVFNCFNQYVKPCIHYMLGQSDVWKPDAVLPLPSDQQKRNGFTYFLKARRSDDELEILRGQQSFNMRTFSRANCIVELEAESEIVEAGTPVKVYDL